MYRNVTALEVQESCARNKITRVPHHECGCCGEWTEYGIEYGDIFYDSSCGCGHGYSTPTRRSWYEVAEFVNMQSQSEIKKEIALRFGVDLEVGTTVPDKEE
jgi:hypothetical protein